MRRTAVAAISAAWALIAVDAAYAQRGTGDWMTSAFDAQRSSSVRTDGKISVASLQKPGFELAWKKKLDNPARQLNMITPPALLDFYISYRGFRTLGFFGGSADRVIALDTDLARTEWDKVYKSASNESTLPCPGGMTSAVTRPTSTGYPPVPTGRGAGRGTPAKSGVGEPFQGAVTLKAAPPPPPPTPPRPAAAKPAMAVPNPFAPRVLYVLALTSDGKLHMLYVSNGDEPNQSLSFLPPNAHALGLISYDGSAYVSTTNNCGGVANGVWSIDLSTKQVTSWKAPGNVAGTAGHAAGPDGNVYVAAGKELAALEAKTLKQLGSYKSDADFSSSPVVFEYNGKDLIAVASADGRLHLVDAANLSAAVDKSAPFSAPNFAAGSVTSWQEPSGTRWVLVASAGPAASGFSTNGEVKNGAVAAFKVVDKNGAPSLQPAWLSRDLTSPLPPIVVNGVLFALSSGEHRSHDAKTTIARSSNAVLYALDPSTGKELWNSGNTITSFVHSGGLSAGGSRIYVSGFDGTQYAFGYPIEH